MKTEVIEHRYEFTEEEKNQMAREVTEKELAVADLENQKKSAADEFKAKIEPIYEQIQYLSRCVQNGYEPRNYTCRIEKDKARQVRVFRDVQTEKVVKEEPYTAEDLQDDLPGMTDAPAGDPTPAE